MDQSSPSSVDKERAEGGIEPVGLRDVGREAPIPPEVGASGVKVQPTTVPIPKPVSQLGVKPVGTTTTTTTPPPPLPLSDDQIAKGLRQSITSSWRWLAEWCKRMLKKVYA